MQQRTGVWTPTHVGSKRCLAPKPAGAHAAVSFQAKVGAWDRCFPVRTRCLEEVVHLQHGDPLEHLHELWPTEFVPRPYSRAKLRHRALGQTQAHCAQARRVHLTTPFFVRVAQNAMEDREVKPRRALLDDDLRPGLPDPVEPHTRERAKCRDLGWKRKPRVLVVLVRGIQRTGAKTIF